MSEVDLKPKTSTLDPKEFGVDIEALRARYAEERARRVREEGRLQYVETAGEFARYREEDPFVEPGFTRAPVEDEVEVLVLGGGFAGLMAGVRLREAGLDFRIIESGGDYGGTWYWNRYPGAQCDIESYCYLPLLEETGFMPKHKYSFAPEIFEHCQRIGKQWNLYERTWFQTNVTGFEWNPETNRWIVSTNRNDKIKARFVITGTGPLSRPKLPAIPGIQNFKGKTFHTSRWDYSYTGGSHDGKLDKLADKRVAIIGTGCTAVQAAPHVGASAKHLYVFQRTPSSIDRRDNRLTDQSWAQNLKPGWQRERQRNFNAIFSGNDVEDLVHDGWTDTTRIRFSLVSLMGGPENLTPDEMATLGEIADGLKMSEIRARTDFLVHDREVSDRLKAWYRFGCKRPVFNDTYLQTFNRSNVTLVDVSGTKGVERITETGIVANGVEYPVDCIIFATGFEAGTEFRRRVDFDVIGENGVALYSEHWKDGMRTFHGHSSDGFPNWFYIGVGQVGLSSNMTAMLDEQADHLVEIIKAVRARGATRIEATPQAVDEWVAVCRDQAVDREYLRSCTPGTNNSEGNPDLPGTMLTDAFGLRIDEYNRLLEEWRAGGTFAGMTVS